MYEFLTRPTLEANWWAPPHSNVLAGRDLLRPERGTWLGITREGRIAVLTNFREEGAIKPEARSRGAMVNAFLTQPGDSSVTTENFVRSLMEGEGLKGIGGFSLVCGIVGEPLAVISNRTPSADEVVWIMSKTGETVGLSNTTFADRSWTKVTRGEKMMAEAIEKNVAAQGSKDSLMQTLLSILSDDTLPRTTTGQSWESQVKELRKSIFIPAVGVEGAGNESREDLAAASSKESVSVEKPKGQESKKDGFSGGYGTQKQTVVIVSNEGRVTFMERTIYDVDGQEVSEEERDRVFEFDIGR